MLVQALSGAVLTLLVISSVTALPRDQRQIGFFSPAWGLPAAGDYGESGEDAGSNPDYPDYSSLGSMLQGMQAMMTRMRHQLSDAMQRFPKPEIPRPFKPSDIGFDESKPTNSSSTTKVVNGHKVTVNETTYSSKDGGASSLFHVRIVDISPHQGDEDKDEIPAAPETVLEVEVPAVAEPQMPEEETSKLSEETPSMPQETPTPASNSASDENEIPQKREGRLLTEGTEGMWQQDRLPPRPASSLQMGGGPAWASNVFPDWPALPRIASKWRQIGLKGRGYKPDLDADLRGYKPELRGYNEPDSDVEMVPGVQMRPIDLGSDLRVNQLMSERAQAGGLVMPDPDSEFVELVDGKIVPNIQIA